jgi:hypothetical protein
VKKGKAFRDRRLWLTWLSTITDDAETASSDRNHFNAAELFGRLAAQARRSFAR